MEQKAEKLEAENRSLLDRWMAKIKDEAETMNDANEFLAKVHGIRLASPTTSQHDPDKEKEGTV
jgi:Autophagy protein 16 (ATG16)